MKTALISAGIFLFAVIILGGWYLFSQQSQISQSTPSPTVPATPTPGPITLRGHLVCLPHKNTTGFQTMECAYGLKDSAGRYFAVRDADPTYQNISSVPTNSEVEVHGTFTPQTDMKYQSIGVVTVTKITQLSPSPSPSLELPTKYISAVDWPPKMSIENKPFTCTEAGSETKRAGQTEKVVIGTTPYCVTKVTEGAAGSIYTQYAYARAKDNQTEIFTFSLRFVQCGNYPDPEKTACEKERQTFSLDTFIDQYIRNN